MRTVMPFSAPWPATPNIERRRATVSGPGAKPCMRSRIASHPTTCRSWRLSCSSKCSRQATPRWRNFTICTGQTGGAQYLQRESTVGGDRRCRRAAGIGLTFLPTLYQCSDFGGSAAETRAGAIRIWTPTHSCMQSQIRSTRIAGARCAHTLRTGAAFHSLRAVPLDALREARARAAQHRCRPCRCTSMSRSNCWKCAPASAATGRRPIELLLDQALLTQHWCVVHATHATAGGTERHCGEPTQPCAYPSAPKRISATGFSTAARFLKMDGRLCVGSDSQSTVNPAEELRWLEYQQRLRKKRRGVLATSAEPHVGTRLWRDAAENGAQALGQPVGSIAVGSPRRLAGAGRGASLHGGSGRGRCAGSPAVRRRRCGHPRRHGRRAAG